MRKLLLALLLLLGTFGSYAQSNLSVFSTNPDNSYIDGETLTWTVMITNNGPMPATNVKAFYALPSFILPLPPGITKFWWFKDNGTTASGTNSALNNTTPVLAVGQTITYTLNLKVPNGYTGTIPELQVTYAKSADLEVVNTDNQTTYTPGTQRVYNVTVINHGPEVADPVSIAMPIPAGITNFSWTGSNGSSGTNTALADNIGQMTVNQEVTYTVTVDVPATYSGPLTTQATLTSPNTVDPVPGCTQCTDVDNSTADADVVVVNTNNQTVYTAGGTSIYTVTVTNNGPAAATNVQVSNAIPAGVTAFSWTGSNGSSGTNVPLSDLIPTLALNQTVTYTITLGVPAGYNSPTFVSQTVVTSDKDPDATCSKCTDTDINPATAANVVLVNTDGQTTYTPGSTVVYTVTVTNNGPNLAQNVKVFDAIPAGITNFSWSGTNGAAGTNTPLSNTIPSMPNGQVITYTVTVQVPASFEGDLVNTASVTSNNDPDPSCTQCVDIDTSSTPTANIVVTNTNGQDIYTPGTNSVYTVTVTNNGPYAATNVVVTNPVPAGITAFSWTGSNGSSGTNSALNNTIPTLAVGQTVTYTITLGVPAGYTGNLSSVASANSTVSDPVSANNSVTDTDNNTASADLVVTKTLNQGTTYTAGADAIYTITVTNQGPTAAQNVSVTDAIPAGLTAANASWYGSNGSAGTGNLTDVVPTLAVGETLTYTLTVPVPSNYSTTTNIVNQVVVTSDTPDPNPACPDCTHTATPNPQANIVTWKTNGQKEYFANAQTVYTIVVTNPGPSDAVNVVVHDSKPYNVSLMTWEGNGAGGTGTMHNVIPVLPAGQSVEYTVTIFVKDNHPTFVGPLINTVNVVSDTPDPVPACPGCTDTDQPRVDYVTVDMNAYTTEELVLDVLIDTDCIDVSNITASAGNINGNYGLAYFNRNNAPETSFPIQSGVILRNGHAKFSEGKYYDDNLSSTASGLPDADLQAFAPAGNIMNDVTYLQFEFVPLSTEMSFDFLFSANEYGFYQCTWYDTFAFILTDMTDGTPPVNLAVIPGTTTPVSVGTIRNSLYNGGCTSINPEYFYQYNVTDPSISSINVRGQTIKMQASSVVIPGHTYKIKMAVGDRGDTAFDSSVFLAAGSFNIGQPKVPDDLTIGNGFALCPGEERVINAILTEGTDFVLRWEKDGVELVDASGDPIDTESITVTEPGTYTLKASFPSNPDCFLSDDIRIEYRPEIEVAQPNDLVACGDPTQLHAFDLHENDAVMKAPLPNPDFFEIYYYHSQEEIDNEDPPIYYDPAVGYMGYDGEIIYVATIGFDNSCYTVRQFQLRIYDCNIEMEPYAVHVCEPAPYDGIENFDLTSYTDEMTVADPIPAEYVYTYYNNQADAEAPANPIANPEAYAGTSETIWVRVDDSSVTDVTVYGVEQLTLVVDPQPDMGVIADVFQCGSYTLPALPMGNYYNGPGGTGGMIDPTVPLTASQTVYAYAVTGTAPDTCSGETSFEVTIYPSPDVDDIADLQACDGYELPALTEGNYYTGPGGTGTQLFAGDIITTTQTIYIYAVSGDSTTVCEDESDFLVTINYAPAVSPATPLERCADNADEQTYFDLTVAGAEILNGQTGLTITYHETPEDAEFGTNPIPNPSNYDNLVSPVYASVIQSGTTTNCRSVVPIELIVHPRPAAPVLSDYVLCDDDTDGVQVFDLTTKNTEANGGDTSLTVAYYITKEDALAGQAPISPDTAFSNTVAGTQQIWVGIATTFGCRSVAPLTLRVNPLPVLSNDANAYIANECEEVPGQAEFHLEEIAAAITDGAPGYSVVFYLTPEQAEFGGTDYLPTPYLSGDTTLYPRITDDITGCYTTGVTVDLNVIPAPIATPPAPIEECDFNNDGFAQFDMTGAMAAIEAALGNVEVTAYETPEDAEHDVNPIPNPDNYTNINQNGQTIYLRVQSTLTDCYDLVTLQLIVNPVPEATEPSDYALCDDGASDTDGIATFDLTIKAAEILGSLDPAQYSISYHVSNDDAVNGTPSIINAASYPSGTATIYVRVTNNTTGCYDIVTLELIVNPLPELITNQSVYTLCDTTAPMDKEVFDLTSRIPDFIADASGMTITFHHSFADAQGDTNPISEADALAYENQVPQVETLFVRFEVTATGCYRIGFLDLRVEHQPIILEPTQDELTVCDTNGQGIGEFDLAALEESMTNGDLDLVITFHETAEDAIAGINPIPTTENYVNAVPYIQDIYVRVTDTRSGCSNTVPYVLTLIVSPAPQAPSLEDLTFCDDADNNGQDGKRRVDLTVQNAVIAAALGLTIPDDLIVEYYTTETGANSGLANRITNPATYMGSDQQVIWVRVEDPVTGCYSVESFMLIFNAPHALTTPSPLAICNEALPNDGQTEFDLTVREDQLLGPSGIGQGYTVEYYESDPRVDTGAIAIADPEHYTNPAPPAGNPKTLFVKVTTQDGCVSYTTLTIKVLPLPTPDTTPDALVLCDDNGDGDGVEEFDLTQAAADIKDNGSNYILTYYTTQEDAQNEVNPIADPSAYESGTGSVWVRVALDMHNPAEPMCAQIVELPLIVNPLPPVADLEPFAHCEQNTDGAYDFNIQEYVNNALGGNEADEYDVDFFEDAALTTPAVPVTAYPVTGGSGTVYVRVTNNDTGCMIVKELSLLVEEGAIANPITTVFDECDYDGANDGIISTWNLTVVEGEVLGTQDPAGYEVTYYTSLEDAENYENAIATPEAYTNTIADDQTIWVRVTNTATLSKCHDITTFTLHVERLAEPVITGENGSNTVCVDVDGTTDGLLLDSGVVPAGHSYRWFLDGVELTDADPSSGTYLAVSEGDYTVEVTGPLPNACVSDLSAVFTVIKSGMASPVGAGYYVTNYFSDNQVITITVEGNGEYVYQLDEGPTQTSPVFTNVSPGPHTVRVYDVKTEFSCGVLPIEGVSVVDYPNFFTPNGDGFHDTWNIIGLQNTGSVIYIFDRYGKLIKQISPDLESDGWDGTFNGTPLPADDYWFSVTYPEFDGTTTVTREFKAHFSLKR